MHIKQAITAIIALMIAALSPAPALAWSEGTHQLTGEIAYDDLAANRPQVLAALVKILPAHPHYARLAARAEGLTGAARDRVIFGWLARWPDDIRTSPYDNPEWHYDLRVAHGWDNLGVGASGKASEGFARNLATLSNAKAAASQRAIAMGWLLHIVGDIQQPLHAGHRLSWGFLMSDRAGQLAHVRRLPDARAIDMHEFWDQFLELGGSKLPKGETSWSKVIAARWPRASLKEVVPVASAQADFGRWLDESFFLAKRFAYSGTFLQATKDPRDAPVVSRRENETTNALAIRRVATGGYRIADVLAFAVGGGG